MSNVRNILSEEQQVERLVEALRTANQDIVFKAFCEAPTNVVMSMRNMLEFILQNRDDVPECECD